MPDSIQTPIRRQTLANLFHALFRLRRQTFDVVLLNLSLPDSPSLLDSFLDVNACASSTPIVVLADEADEHLANRLLRDGDIFGVSALARFDRDALVLPGVTHIVLLEGLNDIGFPGAKMDGQYLADPTEMRSANEITDAYRQLVSRAHARGLKVVGATLTPCEGAKIPGYYSEQKEATRQAVNKWIRTAGAFDGVIEVWEA